MTAYDIDPLATAAIGVNAAANGVTVLAVCADILDDDGLPAPGTDLVRAADAFYQRDLAAKVIGSSNGPAPAEQPSWPATSAGPICPAPS